jgi:hypothetical protein
MAWMAPIIAASNKDGRKRRRKGTDNKLTLIFSIVLIIIGSLVPLGVIFLSSTNGETFPVFMVGIVFLIIFGSLILAFAVMETEYEEEDDCSKRVYQRKPRCSMRDNREIDEKFYWGEPNLTRSTVNYCSQCGSQIEFEDQFCSTCGRRI